MGRQQYVCFMEKKMETTIVYRGYIGVMEKKTETTIVYRDYMAYFILTLQAQLARTQLEPRRSKGTRSGKRQPQQSQRVHVAI